MRCQHIEDGNLQQHEKLAAACVSPRRPLFRFQTPADLSSQTLCLPSKHRHAAAVFSTFRCAGVEAVHDNGSIDLASGSTEVAPIGGSGELIAELWRLLTCACVSLTSVARLKARTFKPCRLASAVTRVEAMALGQHTIAAHCRCFS